MIFPVKLWSHRHCRDIACAKTGDAQLFRIAVTLLSLVRSFVLPFLVRIVLSLILLSAPTLLRDVLGVSHCRIVWKNLCRWCGCRMLERRHCLAKSIRLDPTPYCLSLSRSPSRSLESAFPSVFACTAAIISCCSSDLYSQRTRSIFQSPIAMVHLAAWSHPEEPQPLAQALSYSLRSKGASIDFRWPLHSEAKQARDERFTMGISVESMYRDLNQTFSCPSFRFWSVAWSRDIDCPYCKAELNRNGLPCRRCNGKGTERVAHRGVTMEFECPLCHGVGRVSKRSSFSCPYCNVLFFIQPRLIDRIRMFSTKWWRNRSWSGKARPIGLWFDSREKAIRMATSCSRCAMSYPEGFRLWMAIFTIITCWPCKNGVVRSRFS